VLLIAAAIQPAFWNRSRHLQDKILCGDQGNTLLYMAGMGGNARKRDAEEPF
jgi:hypothetical protein